MARVLRPYHYLTVAKEDREDPHLVRERVKCGKPSCRCAQDLRHRHGPYIYLRYEEFDPARSKRTSRRVPLRSEPLSAFQRSEATGALRPFLGPRVGKHGFDSPTGFDSQASLFEIAFEGLALAA